MSSIVLRGAVACVVAACGAITACGADSNERADPEPQPQPEPVPAETVEQTPVVPGVIRVVNDTEETIVLDRSFGPASPFGVVELGPGMERPLSLDQEDDAQSGTWVATCECECSASDCAECEPPEVVQITLAPGDEHTFEWNGQLRRRRHHRSGAPCWTTILAQPGNYVFTACAEDGRCGRAEVSLPATSIEIRMSARAAATCDDFDAERSWAARGRIVGELRNVLRDRPLDECARVSCVPPEQLDEELTAARSHPCTVFIVPRENEVEVRAFMPLPEGTHGGESYGNFYDPDLTRMFRARYEQ